MYHTRTFKFVFACCEQSIQSLVQAQEESLWLFFFLKKNIFLGGFGRGADFPRDQI
jgi:hypothetical protein